jgi:hypothetical protein
MGSGAVICVPSFLKIGSGAQINKGGGNTDTHKNKHIHTGSNVIS